MRIEGQSKVEKEKRCKDSAFFVALLGIVHNYCVFFVGLIYLAIGNQHLTSTIL